MTDRDSTELGWVPDACSLPTVERPLRRAEFDVLFAAVRSGERVAPQHLRLQFAGDQEMADSVRDLAGRETQCCSFFTFRVDRPTSEVVQLDIEVPAGYVHVLDSLEARSILVQRHS